MLATVARGQFKTTTASIHWLCESSVGNIDAAFLHPDEAAAYAALRTPKRRHDWLLGRLTAKRLIRHALAERFGYDLPPQAIVILSHPDGWPQVSFPTLSDPPPLTLTISHTGERAFCAVAFGANVPLGADIETVETRSPGFIADYFTADERDLVAVAPEDRRTVIANAVWSGKEAALKAIRRGLAEDTRLVTCLPSIHMDDDGWWPLRYRWEVSKRDLPPLSGRWRELDGFVMSLACPALS